MTLPAQPHNIEADRTALAPYNFVPLPEQVAKVDELPDQDRFHESRLSGSLDCELITASPLYTRAALTTEQAKDGKKAKDQPQFFYLRNENEPVIPGSTLRGMLRAMVEIASFGKVSDVSPKHLVYRAVGDTTSHGAAYRDRFMRDEGDKHYVPQIRGGYMVKQGSDWFIQPAKEIGGTTYAHLRIDEQLFRSLRPIEGCRNAFEVYIKTGTYDFQPVRGGFLHVKFARVLHAQANPGPGLRLATLANSGLMFSKRTEAVIFEKDTTKKPLPVPDELVQDYEEQLSTEQKELLGDAGVLQYGQNASKRKLDDKDNKQQGQPVFYLLDDNGKVFYFGHARMFRVPYPRSVLDFLPKALRKVEDLDLAEAIFGHTKRDTPEGKKLEGKARSYAGRVFVSDANLASDHQDIWLSPRRPVTLKILSGPKPTTFQHYLV
ncbi:MAG: TIGR03986 family CRISPR-associated RAMP protein, partial [Anaerolineae bacterium]